MFYKISDNKLKELGDIIELNKENLDCYHNRIDANEDGLSNLDKELQEELETMQEIETYHHKNGEIILYRTNKGNLYIKEKSCFEGESTNLFNIYKKVKNDINDDFYKWLEKNNINKD